MSQNKELSYQSLEEVHNEEETKMPSQVTGAEPLLLVEPILHSNGGIAWRKMEAEGTHLLYLEQQLAMYLKAGLEVPEPIKRAAIKYYPGSITGLRVQAGQEVSKPAGYWTKERIEEAVRLFLLEHPLTQRNLRVYNSPLNSAIKDNYPGGLTALKAKFKISEPVHRPHYWTKERILEEVADLLKTHGEVTGETIKSVRGLYSAIRDLYPGNYTQVLRDLGVNIDRKNSGYWTTEQIEKAAFEFYTAHRKLTHGLLKQHKLNSLSERIATKYPGGINALTEKFEQRRHSKLSLEELLGEEYESE